MTAVKSEGTGEVEKKEDLVTITVDDVEVSVPKGTLVIRAAELVGIEIPRFCDHPLLDPVGACRQCMVEIPDMGNGRGFPKPQASCTITVMPGMKVKTQLTSPQAEKAQQREMAKQQAMNALAMESEKLDQERAGVDEQRAKTADMLAKEGAKERANISREDVKARHKADQAVLDHQLQQQTAGVPAESV